MKKKKRERNRIGQIDKQTCLSLSLCLMETNVFLPCLALMVICDCHRYFDIGATFLFVCWQKKNTMKKKK
jgi:hypothetical protein